MPVGLRMATHFIFGLLIFGLFSFSAQAELPVRILELQVDGSGCPTGTARAMVTPDGSAVSILFDRFSVSAQKGVVPWQSLRKFCHFRIPVQVAPGFSLQTTQVTYRGFVNLTDRSTGWIYTTGPLSNPSDYLWNETFQRTILNNTVGNITINQMINANPSARGCSSESVIDFNTFIQILGGYGRNPGIFRADAEFTIDTGDLGGMGEDIRVNFQLIPCRQ